MQALPHVASPQKRPTLQGVRNARFLGSMTGWFAGLVVAACCYAETAPEQRLVDYVDPFLGTAPITKVEDIGFAPPWRVWAGLTFPGASLPNAMVQLSPITEFGSGAGYEYEDTTIEAFAHTNKGHWNLCHVPLLPATGEVDPRDFASEFSHAREAASPGYYRVHLDRYDVDAELTSTLRCGLHKYAFPAGATKKLIANLARSNERVSEWKIEQEGDSAFQGFQQTRDRVYFYATANHKIESIERLGWRRRPLSVVTFVEDEGPLEIRVGLSFVSVANAKENLEAELAGKTFDDVRIAASQTWERLLHKIEVQGGTPRQRGLFYSCLYRSFLWPALRSDVNGQYVVRNGEP
ncbi:MAG: glycoside hydrolase family 92 protein, partial [Planctomycetales bacterium]|nr:glycoside hydrolase family 92 protein [Planctomycetales bacterium]